ncbi:L-piperidine-6-carboxylate dehydrogenase [Marinicauda sp. Alg238-R41]|uniref:L-piperidine-6-carboxylate dehydrogenase n=1 Tax=Marinicauda sp. Alg238-R41 TaxID=2993447 RepID=UPI0022E6B58B|nr:aldehyde dehydrogenase family protein [Marinicauda sp. Alg238-R41]
MANLTQRERPSNDRTADKAGPLSYADLARSLFARLGVDLPEADSNGLVSVTPIDGQTIARTPMHGGSDVDDALARAQAAFLAWRDVPAPRRGELIRLYGQAVREHKETLSRILSIDCGKSIAEARGEIQEVIDICDYAVGLSRQLFGLQIACERPGHRMSETWHPIGVFAQISAFNFPAAVWSWGTMVALVCGNATIWKPSEKASLTALACAGLLEKTARAFPGAPDHLAQLLVGGPDVGRALAESERVAVISATGSTSMGRDVSQRVAARLGRSILELGGNNAAIVAPSADLDLAVAGSVFAAAGTAGQRCTTMRRAIVHENVYDAFLARLKSAANQLRIGNPLDEDTHVGPLIDEAAYEAMQAALRSAKREGGVVWGGERVTQGCPEDGFYVRPAIVEMPAQSEIVLTETFAPVLYAMRYHDLSEAIEMNNAAPQGLSSALFSNDMRETERFLSHLGSDCGIANVNIGTSGAEIGGAFGGEKETGGGRASGSDTWKNYMRRCTNTVNYSSELNLAQGLEFGAA